MNNDNFGQETAIVRAQWQLSSDLFVTYHPSDDPAFWILQLRRSNRTFRFSETQYKLLCAFNSPGHSLDVPLSEREHLFAQKLVRYGLIEHKTVITNTSILSEPSLWEDPVSLAAWALTTYTTTQCRPHISIPTTKTLAQSAGCYVCLKRQGQLRGCFGSISPNLPCLADDIVQNTVMAACWDPRFIPVQTEEITALELSLDIVVAHEQVSWPTTWDTQQYGLQLRRAGAVVATLLPGLEGISSAMQQYHLALRKAGISSEEGVSVEQFTTRRLPSSASLPLRPYTVALSTANWNLWEEDAYNIL